MSITNRQINEILDQTRLRQVPLLARGIAFLFFGYALVQWVILKEPNYPVMTGFALFCTVMLLVLSFQYQRIQWQTNQLLGIIAGLVLASTLLRLYATGQPKQSANLILFMVAAAVVFVSSRWFYILLAVTLAGWGIWVLSLPPNYEPDPDALYWGFVLLASAITAVILHHTGGRVFTKTARDQLKERDQKLKIEHQAMQLQTAALVGKQVTSILDRRELLSKITSLIQKQYHIRYVAIYLPESAALLPARLACVAQSGKRIFTQQTPDETTWLQQLNSVYHNGLISCLDESKPRGTEVGEQTTLFVPLKMGKTPLGVLVLQSSSKASLRASDQQTFHLLADQVSVALENARLYDKILQMNRSLEATVAERTKELQGAYARLERLDKTKSDFITIASHELKTPLTLITSYSQMFAVDESLGENDVYSKWIDRISGGVTRLNEIVERINDVALIDSQALELYLAPVNLHFLLAGIKGRLREDLSARQIQLHLVNVSDCPDVIGDIEALEKVFWQLFTNAMKYTPDGGEIRVTALVHEEAGGETAVEIIVTDTGVGFAPENKDLIFDKFYQTGEVNLHSSGTTTFKGGGAGIGLAIAKGIVEAHSGSIWAHSDGYSEETLPGSQFHVWLPIMQNAVE